jgi:hypothetical protein
MIRVSTRTASTPIAEWIFALAVALGGCSGQPTTGAGAFGGGTSGGGSNGSANGIGNTTGSSSNGGGVADASVASSGGSGSRSGSGSDGGSTSVSGGQDGSASQPSDGGSDQANGGRTTGPTGGSSPSAQFLPKVSGTCPSLRTGTATFMGQPWQLWVGSGGGGPMIIYWHGTGSSSIEATVVLGQQTIDAVVAAGGIVAAPGPSGNGSTGQGMTTGNNVWYTGDFDMADQVVACAIDQLHIDTRRIYASGGSAGGLQSAWQSYARSGYTAAVAPVSGGMTGIMPFWLDPVTMPQDPTNVPSAILTHGAEGKDVVGEDFAQASAAYEADIKSKGGYSIDCNTQGPHMSGPPQISPAIWQFFQDHPFGIKTPYRSPLPSVFPTYCQVGPRLADGGAR